MDVLVTGAAGFIGSHVVRHLLDKGYGVVGLDDLSTGHRYNLPTDDTPRWRFVLGDIREPKRCLEAMQGVDAVMHLAARNSVPRSLDDPRATMDVNVGGTLELLETARSTGVSRFVYASSSSAYGDDPTLPKSEQARPLPRSPYAASKAATEHLGRAWARCWGIHTVGLRFFNVFGPHQDPHSAYAAVIPLFIDAALRSEPAIIHGDGTQSRDFTYVDNVVQGILCALNAPAHASGKVYNIACGDRVTLIDLHESIGRHCGGCPPPRHTDPRPGDVPHSQADIRAARRDLGFAPTVGFHDGLVRTVDWYRKHSPSLVRTTP